MIHAEEIENIAEGVSSSVFNRGDKSRVVQEEMIEDEDRCLHSQ